MGGETARVGRDAAPNKRQFDFLLQLQEFLAGVDADPEHARASAGWKVADTAKGEGERGETDPGECALDRR